MKAKLIACLIVAFSCVATTSLSHTKSTAGIALLDGTKPPHAVDTSGKALPDSSAVQPDKPIILAKDSKDPRRGEMKPEAAFDHGKHNTDVTHTLDGRTLTTCVYCHHTEQPMPVADKPYLRKSERTEVLTARLLEAPNAQPVNSCRHCHFQPSTAATAEYPPKSVRYPRGSDLPESGLLTNETAYHLKCISCHEKAMARDSKLKAPQTCEECHVRNQQ